jgi:hypothetical protein
MSGDPAVLEQDVFGVGVHVDYDIALSRSREVGYRKVG